MEYKLSRTDVKVIRESLKVYSNKCKQLIKIDNETEDCTDEEKYSLTAAITIAECLLENKFKG